MIASGVLHTVRIARDRRLLPLWVLAWVLLVAATPPALAQGGQAGNPLLLDTPQHPVAALDFEARTFAGKRVKLTDYRGRVVMINFWATWCVPCLLEMPSMERLHKTLAGEPFTLLAVNVGESREQIAPFVRKHKFTFDLVLDPIGEISGNYGANRLPLSYIVDRDGNIIRRAIGPREWDSEAALNLFRNLMEQPSVSPASAATAGR